MLLLSGDIKTMGVQYGDRIELNKRSLESKYWKRLVHRYYLIIGGRIAEDVFWSGTILGNLGDVWRNNQDGGLRL